MSHTNHILYLLFLLITCSCKSLHISETKPDQNFHLYLLVGQSNMAGRGEIDSLSTPDNPRILMLTAENRWVIAKDPLHFDKPEVTGVGPGLAFAQKMQTFEENRNVKIGLIPCAVGGTGIDVWQPGRDAYDGRYYPYDDAIKRLQVAMKDGVIKGIIWHQGESDSNDQKAKEYIEKLEKVITLFRNEIGRQEVPFVVGELGYYKENYMLINKELKKLPGIVPLSAVATSETLTHNGDSIHLDSKSARELGRRMALKMHEMHVYKYKDIIKPLPRSTPEAEEVCGKGIGEYLQAVKKSGQDLHSLMILRHGKVVAEHWFGDYAADKPHIMNSVSKTFTATAIGFAVSEGKLKLTDKVISFFPDKLPASVSQELKDLDIKHLLTMSVGHDPNAVREKIGNNDDWATAFLSESITEKPGTQFNYNSMATYMLSAIIQKVTGEKLIDYLYPRLFRPLGIVGATWEECPRRVNIGGWGLYLKTEDMAKFGQFFLQKGKWNGIQLLPESWIDEATASHIASHPAGSKKEELKIKLENSDWLQGYGYQIWRCRHNSYRAAGAGGQFIIVLPEKDVVIVTTAHIGDMQSELNLIWEYLLPAIK